MINVSSRVHRILKRLDGFFEGDPGLDSRKESKLGICHGIYLNADADLPSKIYIMEDGIVVECGESSESLEYDQVKSVIVREIDDDARWLDVSLSDGSLKSVFISTVINGRLYESYEFARFLGRVVEDRKGDGQSRIHAR